MAVESSDPLFITMISSTIFGIAFITLEIDFSSLNAGIMTTIRLPQKTLSI